MILHNLVQSQLTLIYTVFFSLPDVRSTTDDRTDSDDIALSSKTFQHCCFSLVISILISFQLVFMMLTIFSSILVIVRERFLKIVVITVC